MTKQQIINGLQGASTRMESGEKERLGMFLLTADKWGHMLIDLRGEAIASFQIKGTDRDELSRIADKMLRELEDMRENDLRRDLRTPW